MTLALVLVLGLALTLALALASHEHLGVEGLVDEASGVDIGRVARLIGGLGPRGIVGLVGRRSRILARNLVENVAEKSIILGEGALAIGSRHVSVVEPEIRHDNGEVCRRCYRK